MKALQARLPKGYPAVHGETAEAIKGALFDAVRPGDAIVVKASNGIGFSKLVTAMKEAFPQEGTKEKAAEEAAGV
jgi:UDP-N-acetylmuramoyl-tripeptide--D-alanyl-D-alanine ligase